MKTLTELLRGPGPVLGTWTQIGAPEVIDILGAAGFDFTVVDAEHGSFGMEAVEVLGLDPDRLIFVKAEKDEGVLSVMESAARTSGVAAIVGEVSSVDLTAGRRLQLACEHHGAIAFALRRRFSAPLRERAEKHSTETTRWRIASAPSDTSLPGLGPARWEVHLERSRNGRPGAWIMEAHNAADEKESPKTGPKTGIVAVVAELADHTAETRARRQPPGWAAGSRDHDPGRQYAALGRG